MALAKISKKAQELADKQAAKEEKAKTEAATAKAAKRVVEASKESRKAEQEADDNYHVFTRHGVTERYHKDSVKNPQRYEQSWNERQDTRKFFLDDAREFLNTTKDRKTLDGMLQRWSKLRNKPEFARQKWEEFVDNASLSPDTKQALKEGFDDIMWTWETTSND
jgi:viroplasmin and RNaseH domain-containing protein